MRLKTTGDESSYDDEGMLKEKDLTNHLDANPDEKKKDKEPGSGAKTDKEKKDLLKKIKVRDFDYRLGPLTSEGLQTDNQVMHGLEILLSYEIFKNKIKP